MSQELIAIVAAAIAISGLVLRLGARMDNQVDGLEGRIEGLEGGLNIVSERVARIEEMLGALLPAAKEPEAAPN